MLHWLNSYLPFDRRITHSPLASRQNFLKSSTVGDSEATWDLPQRTPRFALKGHSGCLCWHSVYQ
jgi:hypothetical protein